MNELTKNQRTIIFLELLPELYRDNELVEYILKILREKEK